MRFARVTLAALALAVLAPAGALAHGAAQGRPPTDPLGIALAWHLDVSLILGLAAAAAAYLSAARSVGAAHRANPWPRRRTVAYLAALAAVGLALL